jgi:HEAT repeat protein
MNLTKLFTANRRTQCHRAIFLLAFTLAGSAGRAQQAAADPFDGLARFQFGQSRQPLAVIEDQIRKTAPADYKQIEARLLPILNAPQTPKDAKRYICRWLAVVGSAECVPAVAGLLTDPNLSHPARMALEPMADPAAGAALRAALPKLKGNLLVGVIGSLGVRREAGAVEALAGLMNEADPLVAGTALAALGQIGTEEAARVLEGANVPAPLARTLARARVAAASRLVAAGRNAQAVVILQNLMQPQQPQAIRVAALKGLIGALPGAEAVRLVVDMVQGEDTAMRSATIAAYSTSANTALKDAVAGELPAMKPAGQIILLGVLADQPEVAARAAVLNVLAASPDDKVRAAAVECLARHGEAGDVALVVRLGSDPAAPVADAARKTLLRMGKPGVDDALVRLIESPRAEDRAVVLATLANRRVESALPTLVRLMNGTDAALAVEAVKALGVMGKSGQLKDVAGVLAATGNGSLRAAAEDAARAICRRSTDKPASAVVLLAALNQASATTARGSLLQALVYTGGDPALNAVLRAMKDNDAAVKAAATRALVSWPEAAAGPHLVELARTTPDSGQAIVALRDGCLRLAEMDELPLAQRVNIVRYVLEAAKRAEEKKRALAALGEMPSLGALDILQGCAKDAALQADATRAAVKLARQVGAAYPKQTLAALQDIKAQASTDELRGQVETAIKAVQNAGQSPDGFILAWMLSGPYTQEGQDGNGLFDVAFPPEKAGAQAEWRPTAASKAGLIELDKTMQGENRVAYLRSQIASGRDQDALLEMGSDDGLKVWLNGKVVHANNVIRPCEPGSDKVKIKLKQGVNSLLLKVTQGGGQWSACCRLRAADGQELADLTVGPNAE